MEYTVTFACGHTQKVDLKGPYKDHGRKLGWLRTQKCLDCKRAAEQEAIRQEAASQGLPDLIGTDKQIAWALSLRRSMLPAVRQCLHAAVAAGQISSDDAYSIDQRVCAVKKARFWIEHRDDRPDVLVDLVQNNAVAM